MVACCSSRGVCTRASRLSLRPRADCPLLLLQPRGGAVDLSCVRAGVWVSSSLVTVCRRSGRGVRHPPRGLRKTPSTWLAQAGGGGGAPGGPDLKPPHKTVLEQSINACSLVQALNETLLATPRQARTSAAVASDACMTASSCTRHSDSSRTMSAHAGRARGSRCQHAWGGRVWTTSVRECGHQAEAITGLCRLMVECSTHGAGAASTRVFMTDPTAQSITMHTTACAPAPAWQPTPFTPPLPHICIPQ